MPLGLVNIYIMDANSLLASTRGEPGGHVAEGLLADPNADCIARSVNLCGVFYDGLRRSDLPTAQQAIADLLALGLTERSDMDRLSGSLSGS